MVRNKRFEIAKGFLPDRQVVLYEDDFYRKTLNSRLLEEFAMFRHQAKSGLFKKIAYSPERCFNAYVYKNDIVFKLMPYNDLSRFSKDDILDHFSEYKPTLKWATGLKRVRAVNVSKRGSIRLFSKKSLARMKFAIRNADFVFQSLVTLTYPRHFSKDGEVCKMHFKHFKDLFRKKFPSYKFFLGDGVSEKGCYALSFFGLLFLLIYEGIIRRLLGLIGILYVGVNINLIILLGLMFVHGVLKRVEILFLILGWRIMLLKRLLFLLMMRVLLRL